MKLYKMEIYRGQEAREVLAHNASEDAAVGRVRAKFTGWDVRNVVEITKATHFQIADLVPEDAKP